MYLYKNYSFTVQVTSNTDHNSSNNESLQNDHLSTPSVLTISNSTHLHGTYGMFAWLANAAQICYTIQVDKTAEHN